MTKSGSSFVKILAGLFLSVSLSLCASEKENIALGKSYTSSIKPNAFSNGYDGNPMCKDDGDMIQLTDGELADSCWWDKRTVGWWQEGELSVTIDLKEVTAVDEIEVHLSSEIDGYRVPRQLIVFVSDDNVSFHPAAELDKAELLRQWKSGMTEAAKDGNPHAWIKIKNMKTKGRYVTLMFSVVNLYLDEVKIFSGNLKAEDIKIPENEWTKDLNIYPFYKANKGYVAGNLVFPFQLSVLEGIDITLDLPGEISLIAPAPAGTAEKIAFEGQDYNRYKIKKTKCLFMKSSAPEGVEKKIRISGNDNKTQTITVQTVKIPEVKAFKKLMTGVGFTDYLYWEKWPDGVKNYSKTGLNIFTIFGHTDYYYQLMAKRNQNALNMISEARKKGLKIAGGFSPFCNGAIKGSGKGNDAVFLNGKPAKEKCPRCYLKNIDSSKGELAQAVAGANAGVDIFFFDSEPYWPGPICSCPVCENEWKEFLSRKASDLPHKTLLATYVQKDSVYMPLMQEFWDEFYCKLWGTFKERMNQAAGKEVCLALYDRPLRSDEADGSAYLFGNNPLFLPLYNSNIVNCANPSFYLIPTEKFGKSVRELRKSLPPSAPIYLWVTTGSLDIMFERTPEDLRHRLLELFFNGAQGFYFWNAYGVDANDYKVIAEVIRDLGPYEPFFLNGQLIDEKAIELPKGVKASGIRLGKEAVLLVNRYLQNSPAKITVKINSLVKNLPVRIAEPIDGSGETYFIKDGKFEIEFSGNEKDYVKIFHLHP